MYVDYYCLLFKILVIVIFVMSECQPKCVTRYKFPLHPALIVSFICLPEMPDFASLQNFAANIDADIGSDEELSGDENELMVSRKCNRFL